MASYVEPACAEHFVDWRRKGHSLRRRVNKLMNGDFEGVPIDMKLSAELLRSYISELDRLKKRNRKTKLPMVSKSTVKR